MRFFRNPSFPLIQKRRISYIISGTLMLLSFVALLTRGLETGIDFQGGTEFVVETGEALPIPDVRDTLTETFGAQPEVKTFGSDHTLLIRTVTGGDNVDELQATVESALAGAFPAASVSTLSISTVGPRFAETLKRGALYAVIASLFVIFLYIAFRFEWEYSVGATVALTHDVVITLGMFALFHHLLPFSLQIDQTIIAALLTIVGYSINDTVVIFDRIREYANLSRTEPLAETVNRSINSTLSRTIMTSTTTLIVVATLFIFGGEVLRGFAFALMFGIGIGTYSSIFVASPVMLELKSRSLATR